jgi:hypothetical protein
MLRFGSIIRWGSDVWKRCRWCVGEARDAAGFRLTRRCHWRSSETCGGDWVGCGRSWRESSVAAAEVVTVCCMYGSHTGRK